MITVDEIYSCLQQEESPVIEFKRDWYWSDSTPSQELARQWGELQKDLISLCNAYVGYCGVNRYLIIGFSETEKKIHSLDLSVIKKLRMLRSTCCAAAASRNLHGTQRYLLKTT